MATDQSHWAYSSPCMSSDSDDSDAVRSLAYIHVPKTGGTSITTGLLDTLRPSLSVGGFDRTLFGGFDDFASLDAGARGHVFVTPEEMPAHADLIAGHFSLATIRHRYPTARTMVIAREPMSRLLSHWTFWRADALTPQPAWGSWAAYLVAAYRHYIDFLTDPNIACQTDNVMVRMLLSPHPSIPAADFIDPAHDHEILRDATRALDTIDHADIFENPCLAQRLSTFIGKDFTLVHVKATQPVPGPYRLNLADELTRATQKAWRARTRLDMVLWERLCAQSMPACDGSQLRLRTQQASLKRYQRLLNDA